ncbi:MAG: PEGA domain-containing protein [Alphaproteobacteria bacterium]|nr:PEGA domain-containing protein [Alphaproteobacteria bacterium]
MPRHPLDHDPELLEALDAPAPGWVRDTPVPTPEPPAPNLQPAIDPSRPPGGPPDIAPPLLLEPIPAPTVTLDPDAVEAPNEAAEVAEDAYAWAAAAASSMEREGRAFDTEEVEIPPPPEPEPWTAPANDPWAHLDDTGSASVTPLVEVAREAPPRVDIATVQGPRTPAARDDAYKWALAGAILMGMSALMVLVIVIRPQFAGDDAVLRPVPASVGGAGSGHRYASPPEPTSSLPGATIALDGGKADPIPAGSPAAPTSSIVVASVPAGAVIRVDGRVYGHTPETLELPYGAYTIELLLDGHASVRQQLDVGPESHDLQFTLSPERALGRAEIVATGWEGATLFVDGTEQGEIPVTIPLAPGDHEFVLVRDGDRMVEQRKVWLPGTRPVTVDLTP